MWLDIKDPTWPSVDYYDDFIKVDTRIKHECISVHNVNNRINEITNPTYWESIHTDAYQKDQFVFINVPKCGFMHHEDFFVQRLGWRKVDYKDIKDSNEIILFGLMMHPLQRYLKGLTEFIYRNNIADCLDLDNFLNQALIPDMHSAPYSMICKPVFNQIHWIPFTTMTDIDTKESMNALFKHYGSQLTIPTQHEATHISPPDKLAIFNKLKQVWETQPLSIYGVYLLHASDIGFYHNLLDTFNPSWSHLAQ